MRESNKNVISDVKAAYQHRHVWLALAAEDVTDQHRRTTLGPLWLLINYLFFVFTFLVIFGHGQSSVNYTAYVAVGFFVWVYISEVITTGITLFVQEEAFIKGTTLPLPVYVMRMVTQILIRSEIVLVGCIAFLFYSGIEWQFGMAWALLGMVVDLH